jgi:hypothetical protein
MRAQTNIISLVIIAGIIIALVGAAYVWAIPLIEKRTTLTEYDTIEGFMLELDKSIVDIANSGSGAVSLQLPRGILSLRPFSYSGGANNTITLDFFVSQPLILEGASIPIKTSSLDYTGEYGKTEPRVIALSRMDDDDRVHLNISMRYRELRSSTPKGYVIALCPVTGFESCQGEISGGNEVTVSYGETVVVPRSLADGGDLTMTKIRIEVN